MRRFGLIWMLGILLLVTGSRCSKEYSLEGNDSLAVTPLPERDSMPGADTSLEKEITACAGCNSSLIEGQWSLSLGDALVCGPIDTAILNLERNAFTFFGPSRCSPDSGLIISVGLDSLKLDKNISNLTIKKATLYYYDNISGLYVVQSEQNKPFSIVILQYDHTTKAVEGTFSGTGFTPGGRQIALTKGRWKTYLY